MVANKRSCSFARIIAFLLIMTITIIPFMAIAGQPSYAESSADILDEGLYCGVPWKFTSDNELILGEEGKSYTFSNYSTSGNTEVPWDELKNPIDDSDHGRTLVIQKISIAGTVVGKGNFRYLFSECDYAESIDLSGLDTSQVTNMQGMFYRCGSIKDIDLSGFDFSNVTDMSYMFMECSKLTSLDLSGFDLSNVTDFTGMFDSCYDLSSLKIGRGFNSTDQTELRARFPVEMRDSENETQYEAGDIIPGDVYREYINDGVIEGVYDGVPWTITIDHTLYIGGGSSNCHFDDKDSRDYYPWHKYKDKVERIRIQGRLYGHGSFESMFSGFSSVTTINLGNFDCYFVTNMKDMFAGCDSLERLYTGPYFNKNIEDPDNYAVFSVPMRDDSTGNEYPVGSTIPVNGIKNSWDTSGTIINSRSFTALDYNPVEPEDPKPDTSSVDSGFTTSYNDKEKRIPFNYGFRYRDEYFTNSATEYNHNLATMSLCLALSGYGYGDYSSYDKNVKKLMEQCGFADDGYYVSYRYNEKPTKDSIACAIGCKTISDNGSEVPVIAVAVRSSGYEAEWASNLTIGDSGNHKGFDESAETIKNYIIDYITNTKLKGNIKIWITGFSRGAAVATQTAAKLDDLAGIVYSDESSESGYTRVNFDNSSIYAYGFATPAGILTSNDPHSSDYSNIYNIIEYNDPVPLVAPQNWSFDRYGTTKILPYRESNNSDDFRRYIELLELRIDAGNGYNLDEFKNYNFIYQIAKNNHDTQGTFLRKTVNGLAKAIGSRSKYNEKYQDKVRRSIENTYANKNDMFLTTEILLAILGEGSQFAIMHPNLSVTLTENMERLAEVHADTDYYLGWMQMMDSNYENSLPLVWGNPNFRVWKANCPVDVYVYDSDNNVVASIVNEEPSDEEDQGIIVSIDENGQKVAYLPVDSEYRVEVKARESCEVSCGVEEYDAESGKLVRVANFETVDIPAEETLSADIPAFSEDEITEGAAEGSDISYTMTKDGEDVNVDNDIRGEEEIAAHTYNVSTVCDDTMGEVYGGGSFTEGSFALIEYACKSGYIFDGFYIDGMKYEDSISEDNSIRVKVTNDMEIEARFVECEHPGAVWKTTKKATELAYGQKTRICSLCGKTETKTIAKLKPSLPAITISSPIAAKKAATIRWRKVSAKNQRKIAKIQIQYSTDKNFKKGVKTVYAKKSATSKKLTKLQSKKTYYVRIRSYKKVGSVVHISKWSKRKYVKVK